MYDFLIVGQGLAGTSLAWNLIKSGAEVMVVDSDQPNSSSRLAAGLITPVTGQRMTSIPRFEQLHAFAQRHYECVSARTRCHENASLYKEKPAVRLCLTQTECSALRSRKETASKYLASLVRPLPEQFKNVIDSCTLLNAAQVDLPHYLQTSREYFQSTASFKSCVVKPSKISVRHDCVSINAHALTAKHTIFCGGFFDVDNPWLPKDAFEAAKGEVITVRIEGLDEPRVIHGAGIWLCPTKESFIYRCGATFERGDLSTSTTTKGRSELLSRLQSFISTPIDVTDQQAAVRPIGRNRNPIIGQHSDLPISWFNGLGSKGALWAPLLSHHVAKQLVLGNSLNDLPSQQEMARRISVDDGLCCFL